MGQSQGWYEAYNRTLRGFIENADWAKAARHYSREEMAELWAIHEESLADVRAVTKNLQDTYDWGTRRGNPGAHETYLSRKINEYEARVRAHEFIGELFMAFIPPESESDEWPDGLSFIQAHIVILKLQQEHIRVELLLLGEAPPTPEQ